MTKKEIIALLNKEKIQDIEIQTSDLDNDFGVHFTITLKNDKQVSFSQYLCQKITFEAPYAETWEDGNSVSHTTLKPKNFK